MNATADELAGVVDLFGGLSRAELERALSEVAFRADGQSVDDEAADRAIETALESFALIGFDGDAAGVPADETLFVAGPTAFPKVPEHAEDLPHILDVPPRRLDRTAVGEAARERFSRALEDALDANDSDRLECLLDVSYDVEAWAPVELADVRERLEHALDEVES